MGGAGWVVGRGPSGVETVKLGGFGSGVDVGDVSAGVEGLVLGLIEVGSIHDLERGIGACGGPARGIGDRDAGVAV